MSTVVDEQVVQLEFNNANFEKNVNQSIKTVEKLKDSMMIGPKTQQAITESIKSIDLSPLVYQIQNISDRFSTFGIAGMTAIQRITNAAIDLAVTLEKRVMGVFNAAWNQIITGGTSRATNIEQATFQLKGIFGEAEEGQIKLKLAMTGTSEEIRTLTGLTEDLIVAENAANYAVADTAYGLDSAAKAASVLATSGVDVIRFQEELADTSGRARTEMQVALRAISGVAAMANSSYDEIAHIFERVSGQGRVMGQDLESLSTRGLNAAAVLTDYLNRMGITANATQADIKDMVSKGKIDFMTFARAMDEAYGEHAKDANSTFSGAFDNMRFALSKIGADFIAPMRDDLIPVLNNVRMAINAVRSSLTPFVEAWKASSHYITDKLVERFGQLIGAGASDAEWKASDQWTTAITNITNVVQLATDILMQFLNLVSSIVDPISAAWKEMFPSQGYAGFVAFLTKIKDFIASSVLSVDAMNKLNRTARGLFSIFKIATQVIKPVITGILQLVGGFGNLKDILTDSVANFGDKLAEIASSNIVFEKTTEIVNKLITNFNNLKTALSSIIPRIKSLTSNFVEKIVAIKQVLSEKIRLPFLEDVKLNVTDIQIRTDKIREFFEKFKDTVIGIFAKIGGFLKQAGVKIVEVVKSIFTSIGEIFNKPSYMRWEGAFDTATIASLAVMVGAFIAKFLRFVNPIKVLQANYAALFASNKKIFDTLVDSLVTIKKAILNLPELVNNMRFAFGEIKTYLMNAANIQMFKALALALVAFVASVWILSKIDADKAIGGIIAVILIIQYLQDVFDYFAKTKWDPVSIQGAKSGIFALVELAVAVMILAGAITKITDAFDKNPTGAILSLVAIYVIIEELMVVMKLFMKASMLNANPKGVVKLGMAMIELGIAVKLIAGAIKTITNAFDKNPTGAIFSLVAIYAVIGMMMNVMKLFMKSSLLDMNTKGIAKAGFAMLEMGAAIALIALAIKIASTAFSTEDPVPGLLGLISVIAIMSMMVEMLNNLSNSVGNGVTGVFGIQAAASAMVGVALALAIVGATVAGLAIAYSKNPAATLASASTVLALLFGITTVLNAFKPEKAIANAFSLIEVAVALAIIGKSVVKIGTLFSADPYAGLSAVGSMLLMLIAAGVALEKLNPAKAQANAWAMIEFAAALYLISLAVAKIGNLGLKDAATGVGGLIAVLLAFAGIAALVGHFPAVAAGLITISACISTMGAAMLFAGAGIALFGIGLVNIAAGIAALAAAWMASGPMIVQGIVGTLSAIAMAIPTVAAALAHGLLTFIEVLLDHLDVIINLVKAIIMSIINTISESIPQIARILLALFLVCLDLIGANIGPLADKLITIVVNLVNSLANRLPDIFGAIENLLGPLFEGLVGLVSRLIGTVAEGIGEVLGALVGGIIKGIEKALEKVSFVEFGEQLADFMLSIEPFLDGLNGLDRDAMESAAILAGVITILTADAIINGVTSWIMGDDYLTKFGKRLAAFGPYIKKFADSVRGIDERSVKTSVYAATMLADFARTIPNEGGWVAKIFGDNDIEEFGKKLASFGPHLKKYADSVEGIDATVVESSANAAKMLSDFARTIPNEGGLIARITGDNDIQTFGRKLKSFGKHIAEYAEEVKDIDSEAVSTSVNAAKMITEFANTIPNSGGLAAIFTGDNTVDVFGEQLALFGASMNNYYNSIKAIDINTVKTITDSLLELFDVLGVSEGVSSTAVGNLRDILEALAAAGLDGYFQAIAVDSSGKLKDTIETFARNVKEYFNDANSGIEDDFRFRGQDVTKAFADGIKDNVSIETVRNAASEVGQAALDALCDSIGDPPGDPATETQPMGLSFDSGFSDGILTNMNLPVNSASTVGGNVIQALANNTTGSYNIGYDTISNFNAGMRDAANNRRSTPIVQHPGYYNPNADSVDSLPEQIPALRGAYRTLMQYQALATESTEDLTDAAEDSSDVFGGLGSSMFNYTRETEDATTSASDLTSTYSEMSEAAEDAAKSNTSVGNTASKSSTKVDKLTQKIKSLMESYENAWTTAKENANKNLFSGVDDQGDAFLDSVQDIMDRYNNIYSSAVEKTNSQDLFAEVNDEDESFAPETLLDRLEDQVNQANEFNTIVASLSGRITDNNLRNAIANMDVDNLPELRALYRMTSSQLGDYERMYQQKVLANQNKIQNELTGELSSLTGEYTNVASYIATDSSTDILVRNLQRQVDQLNEYNSVVASLMGRIEDVNLREAIAHMGVDSIEELRALNSMTDAQLDEYIALYNRKIESGFQSVKNQLSTELSSLLGTEVDIDQFYAMYNGTMDKVGEYVSGDVSTTAGERAGEAIGTGMGNAIGNNNVIMTATNSGRDVTNAMAEGMTEEDVVERVESNAKLIVDTIVEIFTSAYDDFKKIGSNMIDQLCAGIDLERRGYEFTTTFNDLVYGINYALTVNSNHQWLTIGEQISRGIANGIKSDNAISWVETAARIVAIKATNAARNQLQIQSPSKVFAQIGRYVDEGFAIGLREYSGVSEEAAGDMAAGTLSPVQEAIKQLSGMLDGSIDINPTITPTLDLSQVNARSAALANMFNGRQIAVQARADEQQAEMMTQLGSILAEQNAEPRSITFNQTNNSPKALSRTEIYRQTRNGFSQLVSAIS